MYQKSIILSVYFFFSIAYNRSRLKFSFDLKKRKGDYHELAKISANGQITLPVEIRRSLGLKSGDKVLFLQNQNGDIILTNASSQAIRKAQAAFSGAAEAMGVSSEDDIQALVDELRYRKDAE